MIKGIYTISNSDGNAFYKELKQRINEMQDENLTVSVEYSTAITPEGILVQSALILGRE